jgi:hypothetical protein
VQRRYASSDVAFCIVRFTLTVDNSEMHQRAGNSEMGVPKNFENFHYKIVTMKTVSCVDIGAPFSLLFF